MPTTGGVQHNSKLPLPLKRNGLVSYLPSTLPKKKLININLPRASLLLVAVTHHTRPPARPTPSFTPTPTPAPAPSSPPTPVTTAAATLVAVHLRDGRPGALAPVALLAAREVVELARRAVPVAGPLGHRLPLHPAAAAVGGAAVSAAGHPAQPVRLDGLAPRALRPRGEDVVPAFGAVPGGGWLQGGRGKKG